MRLCNLSTGLSTNWPTHPACRLLPAALIFNFMVTSGIASVQAQPSLGSSIIVGTASTRYIYGLSSGSVSTNESVTADATHSFTGLDSADNRQTMSYFGSATAQSDYGNLHVYTTGTLSNSYYNVNNPLFSDENANLNDPNGSPTALVSLGFATFDETFQFGGTALQNGYKARYIFHLDGTNTGTGALADLGVTVDANPDNIFFAGDLGFMSTDWVTSDFAINGVTPQNMHVQFSDQVVFNTNELPEGIDYSGTSDFSGTLKLAGIEVVDPAGNPASGWTVSSGSGTLYSMVTAPEPATLAFLALGGTLALARRKKQTK